jgi:hypothetical protein
MAAVAACEECVTDRVMPTLDWGPIRQIHRADDSWICFAAKEQNYPMVQLGRDEKRVRGETRVNVRVAD